jgi:site-specific recombinase XerD
MKNNENFYEMLHNYITVYLAVYRNSSPKTIKAYKQTLKKFRIYIQDNKGIRFTVMDFTHFSKNNIYDFLVYLRDEKKNAASTLNQRLSAIKSFLKYCAEEDISLSSFYLDVSKIHKFKGEKNITVEYLTQPQLKLLFSIPDVKLKIARRNRFIMILLYESGARIEELVNIRINDLINGETTLLRLLGKGGKVRFIPLLDTTVAHLDAYLHEFHPNPNNDNYLFYTIHNHAQTKMTSGTIDYLLKKYADTAAESDILFPVNLHAHMLRHSIAMAMYKKGIPLSYIKDFLGHSDISSTSIYAYSDRETIVEALESVEHETARIDSKPGKKWKSQEAELLAYCGLD